MAEMVRNGGIIRPSLSARLGGLRHSVAPSQTVIGRLQDCQVSHSLAAFLYGTSTAAEGEG